MKHKIITLFVLFTIFLYLFIPNAYLPPASPNEAASAIVGFHCKQSEVEKFIISSEQFAGGKIGQELPAVNVGYLNGLDNYACLVPNKEVLLLWSAAPGYDMNKGLRQVTRLWKKHGRAVIYIDLQEFAVKSYSGDTMDRLLRQALLDGFQEYYLSGATIRGLYHLFSHSEIDTKATDTRWLTLIHQMSLKVIGSISLISESLHDWLATFYSVKLAILNIFLSSLVSGNTDALALIDLKTLLPAMEVLTQYQPRLAPIVIFDHFEVLNKLSDTEARTIIEDLLGTRVKNEQKESIIPTVLVSRDISLWFKRTDMFQTHGIFTPYQVSEVAEEDASHALVNVLKVWTVEEFRKIYAAVGGHSQSIDRIYKYNKFFSQSIDVAIANEGEISSFLLSGAIIQVGITEATDTLKELKSNDFRLVLKSIDEVTPATDTLIHAGILYIDDNLVVMPAYTGMKFAIQRWLELHACDAFSWLTFLQLSLSRFMEMITT